METLKTMKSMQEVIDAQTSTIKLMQDQRELVSKYLGLIRDELLSNCKAELMTNDRALGKAEISNFVITFLQKVIDAMN